jgi:predicted alpha/beta-hydrolase family hydrolase
MSDLSLHFFGPPSTTVVLLVHGAGAGQESPFMQAMAVGLAEQDCRVGLFDFHYMARAQREGRRRPPEPMPRLIECWQQAIELAIGEGARRLVIGGKSMGGRVASMIYEQTAEAVGLVCLGYPFHPIGKPDRLRVEHLHDIRKPVLVIQGERDGLGSREQVAGYRLPDHFQFEWLCDGDHSFKPRKASGYTLEQHQQQAVEIMAGWIKSLR